MYVCSLLFISCTHSGLAIGLVSFLGVFVSCSVLGLTSMRRNKRSRGGDDDSIFNEEADSAELVKGETGAFPTFPQLAKITPSGDTEDLENPTGSSELLNVESTEFGVSADDTTVEAANTKETESAEIIHSIPLPGNADLASVILAEEAGNDDIPPIKTTGSTEFGTPAVLSPPSAPSKTDDQTWMNANGAEKKESWEVQDQDELPSTTTSELSPGGLVV